MLEYTLLNSVEAQCMPVCAAFEWSTDPFRVRQFWISARSPHCSSECSPTHHQLLSSSFHHNVDFWKGERDVAQPSPIVEKL